MADKDIILKLGGPAKLCRLLGFDPKAGGVQRVQNWMTRGIPDAVRLKHYDLFKSAEEADQESAETIPASSEPSPIECGTPNVRSGLDRRRHDPRCDDRRKRGA